MPRSPDRVRLARVIKVTAIIIECCDPSVTAHYLCSCLLSTLHSPHHPRQLFSLSFKDFMQFCDHPDSQQNDFISQS